MPKITSVRSYKVLNSRADWTLHTEVILDDGSTGISVVPEGASKGEREAISLPINNAVNSVNEIIAGKITGMNPVDQEKIDQLMIEMDGTETKSVLGGNAILSVSLAVARAAAHSKKIRLFSYLAEIYGNTKPLKCPTPVFNIINGGKHAQNKLSFQEFMLIPSQKFNYEKQVEIGVDVYHNLKNLLSSEGNITSVGDEGGFAPENLNPRKALKYIKDASKEKYLPGEDIYFGMDVAAESFWSDGTYKIEEEGLNLNQSDLLEYFKSLLDEYELIYIEDPYYEKDLEGWELFNENLGSRVMTVGDDLVVTNSNILKSAIDNKLLGGVIVKPNQVGTLTETFRFIKMAQEAKLAICVSHRSGDTSEDAFISDLAVAVGAEFIKSGAPARGERVSKYNRLLEIFHLLEK